LAYNNANVIYVVVIEVEVNGGNGIIGFKTKRDYAEGINYAYG